MNPSIQDLAERLCLKRSGREWRGTCPACGYGAGAFVLSVSHTGKPLGWCASCRDRDTIHRLICGAPLPASDPTKAARHAAAKVRNAERALSLWRGSSAVPGTPAARYLTWRGLSDLSGSDGLRFRPDTPHPTVGRLPALIAAVTNIAGTIVGVHRTFLTADGCKANVEPNKASLGPVWGGAIRLAAMDADRPLVIGEGIETAASAGRLMGVPAWAAISAGNLAKGLLLPSEARRVVIAADPDNAGKTAAREAWLRWRAEGREVRIAIPDGAGDFNDLLLAREVDHAA